MKKRVIVIHGSGLLFRETLDLLINAVKIELIYSKGIFYFKSSDALIIRRVLGHPRESRIIISYQKLFVAKMLAASLAPAKPPQGAYYEYNEDDLIFNFGSFGLPFSYYERKYRSQQLERRAIKELKTAIHKMKKIQSEMILSNDRKLSEEEIRKRYSNDQEFKEIFALVNSIQTRYESGCTIDSAVAAAFTTFRLITAYSEKKRDLHYGSGYGYDFIEFYQGLRSLIKHAPCSLYISGIPPHTIPNFKDDLIYLKEQGILLEEYIVAESTQEEVDLTLSLKRDGLIKHTNVHKNYEPIFLSQAIYMNHFQAKPLNSSGAESLLSLVQNSLQTQLKSQSDISLLQDLLCSPVSAIEIIETLIRSITNNTLSRTIRGKGWLRIIQELNNYHASISDQLLESVYLVHCSTTNKKTSTTPQSWLSFFKKVKSNNSDLKIVIARAITPAKGKPAHTPGEAAFYYRKKFPEAAYLMYNYGSRLALLRRLHLTNSTINPYQLMPFIGTAGDGSESAYPVARPFENPDYPKQLLGNISSINFQRYVSYLCTKLSNFPLSITAVKNVSEHIDLFRKRRVLKIVFLFMICFLTGIAVILFTKEYRLEDIEMSNRNFYNITKPSGE